LGKGGKKKRWDPQNRQDEIRSCIGSVCLRRSPRVLITTGGPVDMGGRLREGNITSLLTSQAELYKDGEEFFWAVIGVKEGGQARGAPKLV